MPGRNFKKSLDCSGCRFQGTPWIGRRKGKIYAWNLRNNANPYAWDGVRTQGLYRRNQWQVHQKEYRFSMFFHVESWRQVGADAGEAGGCLFCKKNGFKKRQKIKIFGILI